MIESAHIDARHDDDVPVIALVGEFDLTSKDRLQEHLRAVQGTGCTRVVLDLSETRFLDSTILGALARAHHDGLDITIRGASGVVQRAIEVSGLTAIFHTE